MLRTRFFHRRGSDAERAHELRSYFEIGTNENIAQGV
jgi:hypothetical protein